MDQSRTPESRYRAGDRDTEARAAHAADTRAWRRERVEAVFRPLQRELLVAAVARGLSVPEAAGELGLTHQAVYGWARTDEAFARALDEAQRSAAAADTPHGLPTGYRWHGCRCGECRAAKNGGRL